MPDAENSTGNGRCRIEVHDGQGCRHPGILHPHFDRHGPGFSRIEAKQFGHEIAESQTEAIVQDDDSRHQEADIKEAGRTEGDDAANEDDDGDDRHDGHGRQHPFDAAGKEW